MATYQSEQISSGAPARSGIGELTLYGEVELTAIAANGDILQFLKVPKGFTVTGILLDSDELDEGADTILIDVGDSGDTDRLIQDSQVARAGGTQYTLERGAILYEYTSDTVIYGTIGTVGTGLAGVVKLIVYGTMNQY